MKKIQKALLSLGLAATIMSQGAAANIAFAAQTSQTYTPVITTDKKITGVKNGTASLSMELFSRYNSGAMNADGGSLEIVQYNKTNGYAYAVSGLKGQIIAVKLEDQTASDKVTDLSGTGYDVKTLVETVAAEAGFVYGDITSVAISPDGTKLAAAVQHADYNKAGKIAVFTCQKDGSLTNPELFDAGVQPDMVTFADANTVLSADEGEPRNGYGDGCEDPAGTVTILDLSKKTSVQAGFEQYTAEELTSKRILLGAVNGQTLSPAADLEPEYIAVSKDGGKAYVSLQEANAIGVLDIKSKKFTGIYSAGFQDYSQTGIDLVEDNKYEATNYDNLLGARMPDGIALYESGGKTYILTANEGDAREWGSDANAFTNEAKTKAFTGKSIRIIDSTKCSGLPEGKSVMFGGRSFSILEVTENGLTEIFDSGSDFESLTAAAFPGNFNCSNDNTEIDNRSPKKGPEPETIITGTINGKSYAFVALERIGGVVAYDITKPQNSTYVNYINSRDFSDTIKGDVSPEGLCIAQVNGKDVLLAACEVSGTLAAYALTDPSKQEAVTPQKPAPVIAVTSSSQVKLSTTKYVYNGKAKRPSVTAKDKKGKIISSRYYTVSYKSNTKVGKATVTVIFKGNYSGKITKTFNIVPRSTSISKVSGKKKAASVRWKKLSTQVSGYQLQYSTSKKFTKKTTKTLTIKNYKTTSATLKKLKAKKKYYVRIRVYKNVKVSGKTVKYCSAWSKVKAVKTK